MVLNYDVTVSSRGESNLQMCQVEVKAICRCVIIMEMRFGV